MEAEKTDGNGEPKMDGMDKEQTLEFVEDYRMEQLLWDPNLIDYINKGKRNYALATLGKKYNLDVRVVKNKIKNLRSYFSKEHQKVLAKRKELEDESYQSNWFAYKAMSFVLDAVPKETRETGDTLSEVHKNEAIDGAEPPLTKSQKEAKLIEQTMEKAAQDQKLSDNNALLADDKKYSKKRYDEPRIRDECTIFGQLIAHKLRKLTPRNQVLAQQKISTVFFDLELDELKDTSATNILSATGPCATGPCATGPCATVPCANTTCTTCSKTCAAAPCAGKTCASVTCASVPCASATCVNDACASVTDTTCASQLSASDIIGETITVTIANPPNDIVNEVVIHEKQYEQNEMEDAYLVMPDEVLEAINYPEGAYTTIASADGSENGAYTTIAAGDGNENGYALTMVDAMQEKAADYSHYPTKVEVVEYPVEYTTNPPPVVVPSPCQEGNDIISDGNDMIADGTDMIADGTDMIADGTDMIADGTDMIADGSDMITDGNETTRLEGNETSSRVVVKQEYAIEVIEHGCKGPLWQFVPERIG